VPGHRFVVCTQNHDQVGNRASGERRAALVSPGRARVAAALLLTAPFVPMMFQGEEWAASSPFQYFTDHQDPELGRAVSEGRRAEFARFGWDSADVPDPQDRDTFTRSKLDWSELDREPHAGMLGWYRQLLSLRRQHPSLSDPRSGSTIVAADPEGCTLVVRRGRICLLVNVGGIPHTFPLHGPTRLLACSDATASLSRQQVVVPPDAVAIVEALHG
jgi:maltooligosyltrehalose trehalohydrolase